MLSPSWKALTGDVFLPWSDDSACKEAACWGSGLSFQEVCKPQSCGWFDLQPQIDQEVGFDDHQKSLPNNVCTLLWQTLLFQGATFMWWTCRNNLTADLVLLQERQGVICVSVPPSSWQWWQTGILLPVPFPPLCLSVRSYIFSWLPLCYLFYLHAEIQFWTVIT